MPVPAVPMFSMLGSPLQLLVILLILMLLFGAGRLGDIGKGLGEGIKNLKKGLASGDEARNKLEKPEISRATAPSQGSKPPIAESSSKDS